MAMGLEIVNNKMPLLPSGALRLDYRNYAVGALRLGFVYSGGGAFRH